MPSPELEFCKKQLKGWKDHLKIQGKANHEIEKRINQAGIAIDIAVIAGLSALTMGAATKLTAVLLNSEKALAGAGMLMEATTIAEATAVTEASAIAMRGDQVVRVLLGIAAGSTQRLSEQQLAQAFLGLSARLYATTMVSIAATGVRMHMKGEPMTKTKVMKEVGQALLVSLAFAWIAAPGARTPVKSRLIQRVAKEAPHLVNEVGKFPSNQALVTAYKLKDSTFRAIFSGEFAPEKLKAAMVQSGFDVKKRQAELRTKTQHETKLWALEASRELETYTRNKCKTMDFEKEVPWYVDMAHSWREVVGGDTSVGEGLAKTKTEVIVCANQVQFWEAVVAYFEAATPALNASDPVQPSLR